VKPITYILHPKGDSTRDGVMQNVSKEIATLDDSFAWKISIVRYRKPRTLDSNQYLWSVVYPYLVRELGFTDEDLHEFYLMEFFGRYIHTKPNGEKVSRPVRTTTTDENGDKDTLDGKTFWDFVEHIRRKASEGGVYIPDPDKFWKEKRDADLK
jgi:hypothetical protein